MTQSWQNTLRVTQLNAENLFLFLDFPPGNDLRSMTEKQWQSLSHASVPNKSLLKTQWLADSLLDLDSDFILLNEIGGPESLEHFNKLFLGDKYIPYLVEGNSDRGIDVGYLVKKTLPVTCELISHKNRPLGFLYAHEYDPQLELVETEKAKRSHYFSRDCAELRVFRQGESKPALIFLLVHLKSKLDPEGIDSEGRERRAAEARTLAEIYREVRKSFSVPVIVGGDFNGNARHDGTSVEFQALRDTDLLNTCEVMALPMDQACTQIQFQRSGNHQYLQIDYLLIPPELKEALLPDQSGVYRYKSDLKVALPLPVTLDQRLAMPSDHYPVYATFKNFLL
jgi:hypothetical protein